MSRKPKPPTEPLSRAYLFRKVANAKVAVATESGTGIMTYWEALARMIQQQAFSDNASAIRLLHQMRKKFPGKPAPIGKRISVLSDSQMEY